MKTEQKSKARILHGRLGHIEKERVIAASVAGLGILGIVRQDLSHQHYIPCLEAATKQLLRTPSTTSHKTLLT